MFKNSAKAFKFASKRAAAIAATVALTFAGTVALTATPAQAAESTVKYNVRVNRDLVAGQPAVIRPGETLSLYIAAYLDTRSNGSTLVTDIAVDETLSFSPNLTTSLTPDNVNFNWYITGASACYSVTMPQTQQLTWTEAMKTCGGGEGAKYVNPYWSARLTNNTTENVTYSVDPKFVIPSSPDGIAAGTDGFRLSSQANYSAADVTSYVATDLDTSVLFETSNGLCVARDLAAGTAFKASMQMAENGVALSAVNDDVNPYANSTTYVRHLPVGESYLSETLPGVAKITGYSVAYGRVTFTTDGAHRFSGVNADIAGTGIAELDAIDSSYAWSVNDTSITVSQTLSLPDSAYAELTEGTITGSEGGQYHLMPESTQGVKASGSSTVFRPTADAVYTATFGVVNYTDGVTSVARDCGPAAPTFSIDTATSTYNSIAVTVDQTEGASSYSCRAYTTSGTLVYTGYLSESNRAAGQKCQMYALSASTAYNVKVFATSAFEGAGPESAAVSHTTAAGGGYTPPAMVTPELAAPSGSTAIKVTTPALKSMHSAITVTDTSRAYAGANGDVFYGSVNAGTLTVVNNTTSGANTKFAGSGKLEVAGVTNLTSVGWIGAKGTGFAALYRNTAFNNVVKWGSLNSASGMKTQEITQAKLSAFCTSAAGSGYTVGNLVLISSAMSAPFVRVDCNNSADLTKPTRIILATVAASSTSPLVKTSAQLTNYTSTTNACLAVSFGTNKAATSSTAAVLAIATTYAKTVIGPSSSCQYGTGAVAKREVLSISGSGKKLAASLPSASVIPADVTGFSAVPGKSANSWVVLTSSMGSMNSMPGMKFIMTVDAKAKAVKGKNITYSTASAASNAKFTTYSLISGVGQLASGTITGIRSGNATGSTNQSWAAVSISLSTGVVTTGQAITITASSYTGTQTNARNLNITSFTSDKKKVNVYVLADAVTKQYKAATWTLPTK